MKARGGFLFKSAVNDEAFHLGIVPVIMGDQRNRHYDIKLDYEDQTVFSGFFNIDGTIGLLFTPPDKKENISDDFKEKLKTAYMNTAEELISMGLSEEMKLDWISCKALEEIGIYDPIPATLEELIF